MPEQQQEDGGISYAADCQFLRDSEKKTVKYPLGLTTPPVMNRGIKLQLICKLDVMEFILSTDDRVKYSMYVYLVIMDKVICVSLWYCCCYNYLLLFKVFHTLDVNRLSSVYMTYCYFLRHDIFYSSARAGPDLVEAEPGSENNVWASHLGRPTLFFLKKTGDFSPSVSCQFCSVTPIYLFIYFLLKNWRPFCHCRFYSFSLVHSGVAHYFRHVAMCYVAKKWICHSSCGGPFLWGPCSAEHA